MVVIDLKSGDGKDCVNRLVGWLIGEEIRELGGIWYHQILKASP